MAKEVSEEPAHADLVRVLSDDVLAVAFRSLAPRWLAVSRCVCRDWRAAIDARRLLRAELLPLSFRGIFLHFSHHKLPEFFARPSASTISGGLDFLPDTNALYAYDIQDHCNGLLLLNRHVANPATRRWHQLPPCPPAREPVVRTDDDFVDATFSKCLAFDPTVSPHYKVLVVPQQYSINFADAFDPMVDESRWPSSACIVRVFSSRSGGWEESSFVRQGPGFAGASRSRKSLNLRQCAVYWQGALYVQRKANFVVRMSLSNNRYRVISPPAGMRRSIHPTRHLGRSEKGVYFAALDNYRLRIWILDKSHGQMGWMLKHDKDLEPVLRDQHVHGSWMLNSHLPGYKKKQDKFAWDSDSDDLDKIDSAEENKETMVEGNNESSFYNEYANRDTDYLTDEHFFYDPKVRILGFHPFKEVVFLSESVDMGICGKSLQKGLAYHLTTSKIEDLGNVSPTDYTPFKYQLPTIKYSFSFTPCWVEEFPINN